MAIGNREWGGNRRDQLKHEQVLRGTYLFKVRSDLSEVELTHYLG